MDATQARTAAHAAVLDGIRDGRPLADIERDVARCRVSSVYKPDLAMLELIIAALDVAHASRDQPLDSSTWPKRFLPEINYRNRHIERARLIYALHAAAALRTGLRPDVLNDTYGWGRAPLLPYATHAAVMTIRAITDGRDLHLTCEQIPRAARPLEP